MSRSARGTRSPKRGSSLRPQDQLQAPCTVLVVCAHPDDAEWGCGGTVAKLAAAGAHVHFLICTDGAQGDDSGKFTPEQLLAVRKEEQQNAAAMLGVQSVQYLDEHDGFVQSSFELRGKVVYWIRKLRPDIVFTHDPSPFVRFDAGGINHSDHRHVGQAAIDAVYPAARMAHMYPDSINGKMQPHQVPHLLLFDTREPNHYEDVSATAKLKIEALHCHASQFRWRMDEWFDGHMREMGKDVGIDHVEAFRRFKID